jgi:hypothetical protein
VATFESLARRADTGVGYRELDLFAETTKGMIASRKLVENVPITLNMRAK